MANELYVVIKPFTDLQDDNHVYNAGNFYPRDGAKFSKERAKALASADNAQNESLIVQVVKPEQVETFPKHIGGGSYELSNGERVKGKEEAQKVEDNLQKRGE